MKSAIIIPARLQSTRLPNKPLLDCCGKTLLQRTFENANRIDSNVYMATSDRVIVDFCREKSIPCIETWDYESGTHRVAAACEAIGLDSNTVVVNWQVDEPQIDPVAVCELMNQQEENPGRIHTLITHLPYSYRDNENEVKVVASYKRCHWFSRQWMNESFYHIGIYSFHRSMLRSLSKVEPTKLSISNGLEQLAWIESRYVISPVLIGICPISINTKEDLEEYKRWLLETQPENAEQIPAEER